MRLDQPANALVLAALSRRGDHLPALERHDAVDAHEAFAGRGCHPDIVERVWTGLAAALPDDCRHFVHGTPALVHPGGLILAVGMGTQYGLRLPPAARSAATAAGARFTTTWRGGAADIRQLHGIDWIFGAWLDAEPGWCREVHDAAGNGATLHETPGLAGNDAAAPVDPAHTAAAEQAAYVQRLESAAAAGDLESIFSLAQVCMNTAIRQRDPALLQRADTLLARAAAGGHAKAVEMLLAWPFLEADAQRQITRPPPA